MACAWKRKGAGRHPGVAGAVKIGATLGHAHRHAQARSAASRHLLRRGFAGRRVAIGGVALLSGRGQPVGGEAGAHRGRGPCAGVCPQQDRPLADHPAQPHHRRAGGREHDARLSRSAAEAGPGHSGGRAQHAGVHRQRADEPRGGAGRHSGLSRGRVDLRRVAAGGDAAHLRRAADSGGVVQPGQPRRVEQLGRRRWR